MGSVNHNKVMLNMLELFLKLIDRIIQYSEKTATNRKILFEQYFLPFISEFELLHIDYLRSFKNYMEEIDCGATFDSDHKIFEQLNIDSIFSENTRSNFGIFSDKIYILKKTLHEKHLLFDDLESLLFSISKYLGYERDLGKDAVDLNFIEQFDNINRISYGEFLSEISRSKMTAKEKKAYAIFVTKKTVLLLQKKYAEVEYDIANIRLKLNLPKKLVNKPVHRTAKSRRR